MLPMKLQDRRRYLSWGFAAVLGVGLFWWFSPGLPVLIGPWAWSGQAERGQELFSHVWTANDTLAGSDGLGPVFNATSCAACHFQGGLGGAGENKGNVTAYRVRETRQNPAADGFIHLASISSKYQESLPILKKLFPILKGSSTRQRDGHCEYTITIPDFDPISTESIHATALFGTGWIDLISSKAITHQQMSQNFIGTWVEITELKFGTKPHGRARVLADGRIGKFGWKAQFATLEEFVASACANELGLSSPMRDQPQPLGAPHYVTTGTDMSSKQLRDMTAFVATLPRPQEVIPEGQAEVISHGKRIFTKVGCASCHVPDLGGVKGVYSDFLLHDVVTNQDGSGSVSGGDGYGPPEPPGLPERDPREPLPNEWKTPPLWGVASSAPYMHDGSARTLTDAIHRHKGDATGVTKAYKKLNKEDKEALIQFLNTLQAPVDARPVTPPARTGNLVAQR